MTTEPMPLRVRYGGESFDAACLLAALVNHTRPLGLGVLEAVAQDATGLMTRAQAAKILEAHLRSAPARQPFEFDYVLGRPIKMRADSAGVISEQSVKLYERDAGPGAFFAAMVTARLWELAHQHDMDEPRTMNMIEVRIPVDPDDE